MARFLFCPAPEPGDVYPSVSIALELRVRGHDVAYVTAPKVEGELRAEGFRCFSSAGGVYGAEKPVAPETRATTLQRLRLQLDALASVFREFPADVIVDGAFPFGPRLFAELHGVPHASVHAGCFPIPTSDTLFPHGEGHLPPVDDAGRRLARLARLIQNQRDRDEIEAWDAARTELGLPASGQHPWQSAASCHLVLLASSPGFEYPRSDLPPHFWFVGPLLWEPQQALPPRVAAALASPGTTIVYVTQGATFNLNPIVLKLAFAALAAEPLVVVATAARVFDRAEFEPLPPNVILEPFIPFSRMVDSVSAAITHGGAGSAHLALSRGVPLVVLPLAADQFEVAARCAWTGAGIRRDPKTCSPDDLAASVRTVLTQPAFRSNARRVMRSHARYDGGVSAASLLERLAQTRQPVCRPQSDLNPWDGDRAERAFVVEESEGVEADLTQRAHRAEA
jgi:MGT family glycosyltransferase